MRLTRIYTDQALAPENDIILGRDAARHLVTVLRLKRGDELVLFNGDGGEYPAAIADASPKSVTVRTGQRLAVDRESPLAIHLGIGIARGDRFDWVLQKATELGVAAITPLYTERTEVRLKEDREEKKRRHWRQVIVSACEQCGRNRLPALHAPRPLADWLGIEAEQKCLLHHRAGLSLADRASPRPRSAALLIGPEGGLSATEIDLSIGAGFESLALGPRVMRTETAPVAAIALLQYLWGDLGL